MQDRQSSGESRLKTGQAIVPEGEPNGSSSNNQSLTLRVLELAEPDQHLVGSHDIAELLDDVLQCTAVLVVG